ncbi:MAG: hypothetical protein KDH92_14775, partial [Chloroflexi bacterium]|nr:hypothetical protein [Chloroflexota bacterium]
MTKPRVLFAALLLTLFGASAAFAARTASAQEAPSCDLGAYDVNGDAFIGLDDVWVWEHYYEAADARADLNGNGRIQKADVHGIYDLIASPACREAKKVRQPGLGGVKPGQGSFDAGAVTDGLESPDATGGPDNFGYTFRDSDEPGCGLNYTTIVGNPGATRLSLTDDSGSVQQLGFTFPFYGQDRTSVAVT